MTVSASQFIVEVVRSAKDTYFWTLRRKTGGEMLCASKAVYESEEAAIEGVRVVALVLNDGLYDVVRG